MGFFNFFKKAAPVDQHKHPQTISESIAQDIIHRSKMSPSAVDGTFSAYIDTRASGGKSKRGMDRYSKNLIIDHWARRQNTRYALDDSSQARGIVKRKNDSVVGNGLVLDPTPDGNILGISDERLERWSAQVKSLFHLWAKSKNSDITGRNNFYQNTRFYGWQFGRDGDVFVRLYYSNDPKLINPLQIGFIDPNQIRGDEFTFGLGPVSQSDGIEKDENGREISYKVWTVDQSKPGRYKYEIVPAFDEKTGRPIMIHGFNPEWAGQSRGYPELGHALQEFQDMTTYSTATTQKMINASSYGFTVENQMQDPSDMGLPSLSSGGVSSLEVIQQPGTQPAAPQTIGLEAVTSCTVDEATLTEPGTYHLLGGAQGDKLVQIKNEGPAETSGEFIDSKYRYLCASVDVPASVALMKFGTSHSASRAELGLFADVKSIIKDEIDSDFYSVIFGAWMAEEIAMGRIKARGFSDPLLREAWLCHVIIGKPLPDVDPAKTMDAKKKAVDMGLSDLDRESMLYNGSSGKANRAKLRRQIQELSTDPFDLYDPIPIERTQNQEQNNG